MTGRTLIVLLLGFTVLFGATLWWVQTRAFYEETEAETVTIAGRSYPVTEWRGIDATTSPLKLRACFRLAEGAAVDAPAAEKPTPLVAPAWFECFEAEALTRDLEAGRARAFLAAEEEFDGANRMVAVYPDGRAFMWRQLTPEFAEQ